LALKSLRLDLQDMNPSDSNQTDSNQTGANQTGANQQNPPFDETLDDIEDGLTRISAIITDLRTFAYPETAGVHRQFSLTDAVDTAFRFTAAMLEGVAVQRDTPSGIELSGSQTQITQLLVNLILNAADAARSNDAESQPESKPAVTVSASTHGQMATITVADNGPGIPPEVLPRIYDPFFTTKDLDGTGLGLSVSHTIVKNHAGGITVDSSPAGTAFSIELPLHSAAQSAEANHV